MADMKLRRKKDEAPPQSKVVTSVFTPEVKETPRMPPRNRAERRERHREVVRENGGNARRRTQSTSEA